MSELLLRPRSSRIYYRGKFYDYPIRPLNALRNLGAVEAVRCVMSYVWVKIRPPKDQRSLETYVAANYGWRLYRHFFKTYSEKVWAVPASEISADWGAQRIKGMSLWNAVCEPLRARFTGARRDRSKQVTSLIEQFQYPKFGPGMMWERCHELVEGQGSKVALQNEVVRIDHADGRVRSVTSRGPDGGETTYHADHVVSSMPLPILLKIMEPPVPAEVRQAADDLDFRDFLSIALVVPAEKVAWTDNWIYIHAPEVKTMRVQNFGSWSPYLVHGGRNVLGLEYTVREGDEWWNADDDWLIETGKQELESSGLMSAGDVEAGYVVRMPKAYPMYDDTYKANVEVLRGWLEQPTCRTSIPSGATACTGTTTRTTRCSRPCSPSTTSTAPATTSGRSTWRRSTTRRRRTPRRGPPSEQPVGDDPGADGHERQCRHLEPRVAEERHHRQQ